MLGFIGRQIKFKLTGRYHRFGYAAVSFGDPLSLREFVKTCPDNVTECVASEVMKRVRNVVPVLPVPLVATVMLAAGGPLNGAQVAAKVTDLVEQMRANGAHIHVPRDSLDYAAEIGLKILTLRHMVVDKDGEFSICQTQTPALAFYANSIAHLR